MTFILFLLTLLIFVALGLISSSRMKKVRQESPSPKMHIGQTIVDRYYHPGHSWAVVNSPELVTVGVDDFAQRVIGHLSSIRLPVPGASVKQGEVYTTLLRGEKSLPQVAPVSGVIVGVNEKLVKNPELVNSSPFDRGWVVKIAPAHLALEIRNLLKGIVAERWEEAVRKQLVQWFSPKLHPVLQDGGQIVEGVSDLVGNEEWLRLVREFFPVAVTNRSNIHIKN